MYFGHADLSSLRPPYGSGKADRSRRGIIPELRLRFFDAEPGVELILEALEGPSAM
jgi:hypothetical protein